MSNELRAGMRGGLIIIVMALLGFVITQAGVKSHFDEDTTIAKFMIRAGLDDDGINRVLAMPRLTPSGVVLVTSDYRYVVVVHADESDKGFSVEIIYDFREVGKR